MSDTQDARVFFNTTTPISTVPSPLSPRAFHRRLPGYTPTRLVDAPLLATHLCVQKVWVKDESHRLGLPAFKILGASWAAYRVLEQHAQKTLGITLEPWNTLDELRTRLAPLLPLTLATATDGNHGRAVAHIARLLGLQAHIFVPHDTVPARKAAIRSEGAELTEVQGSYDDAVRAAAALASDRCLVVSDTSWEGYTDVPGWVTEGYATIYDEVDEALAERGEAGPDIVFTQMGVGTFAASVIQHYRPMGAHIIGVEPTGAACVLASLEAGHMVTLEGELHTIMAGLNCGTPSPLAWGLLQQGLSASVAIPDVRAEDAMRLMAQSGVESGESGASGLGGALELLTGASSAQAREVLGITGNSCVLIFNTEGATDPVAYERILQRDFL